MGHGGVNNGVRQPRPGRYLVGPRTSVQKSVIAVHVNYCEKVSSIPKYVHYHASWRHCWDYFAILFVLPRAVSSAAFAGFARGRWTWD